ncbi:RrF2 family transcriptional regulator [Novosphingobium colocasiae]|uniref:Rrf2 family transcriptional regulator n=1 Tax=Novosphingobium colocasiae TaxID=1256513 RepID=A0A918PEH7_9SPHN|nr:Rrf2 family transcriptional regulator [Novosphingobium colocasiae]GGZ03564.1 Rrf2 family transcriptional regulator [Novosphingobium colocasiae]
MQLTRHTDFALRLLIHLARLEGGRATIAAVAEEQDIPRTHLMKIAAALAHAGFVAATRGRGGGVVLARPAEDIRIGDVVAAMEPDRALVNCSGCRVARRCTLPRQLDKAMGAFLAVLNEKTLAEIA